MPLNGALVDWIDKWQDDSEVFTVEKEWCGKLATCKYVLMSRVTQKWVSDNHGFYGYYYYGNKLLSTAVGGDYALASREIGTQRDFLFTAQFEQEDWMQIKLKKKYPGGNLQSLRFAKNIDDDYAESIVLERYQGHATRIDGLWGLLKTEILIPKWTAEFYTTEKWRRDHCSRMKNQIVTIEEWMSKFGSVFWEDVDRYQKELTSFLGMDVYSFFEAYKYRK